MFFIENLLTCLYELIPTNDPRYKGPYELVERLLGDLRDAAGKELVDKLTDAQEELRLFEYRQYFLYGLRLGAALLDPQP